MPMRSEGQMTGCPGRDRSSWTSDDIFDVSCPRCGIEVEFFKDDARRRCPSCGLRISNPHREVRCDQWCGAAEQCSIGRSALSDELGGASGRQARQPPFIGPLLR